jgi:SAM-dependent methyltransferase
MAEQHDSKQAEKTYLGRTGGSAWEREKPFSPAGDETLAESIELLHDFAVALRLLDSEPGDLIADLGAGGGWCSDLLQRLNRQSVAIDISLEMLRVSRQRETPRPIRAVAADLEKLPFRDGAFDKAICLNALHHVPNMAAAVSEIARVLSPDGVAVFSEPGAGHADMPISRAAVRDFGVLEQEVLLEPFVASCLAAGFVDVRVCPIAYVIPEFTLSVNEWRAWKRQAHTKRPLRALEKMRRAMLELVGAGKESTLFEEAFGMRLVRLLEQPVEGHPFIVATRSERIRATAAPFRAAIHVHSIPERVVAGAAITASLLIQNRGTKGWAAGHQAPGEVRVGIQLLDGASHVIARDYARASLQADVLPGQTCSPQVTFPAPDRAGTYRLKFDLVVEGVTWFEPTGSPVAIRQLSVDTG